MAQCCRLSLHRRAHDAVTQRRRCIFRPIRNVAGGGREGNGLAAALPAREVGRASRPAGLAGCGVGGHGHGPLDEEEEERNERNERVACQGRKGSGRRKLQRSPAELLRGLGRHSGSSQQRLGFPRQTVELGTLRNNQGRDRTTRQAPRFPARERERELIAFPFPPRRGLSRLPIPEPSSPAHPRSVCVGVCVCGDYWEWEAL